MDKFTNCFFFLKKEPDQGWPIWKYGLYLFYRAAILLCAGLCMGLAVLVLAIGPFTKEIAVSYLQYWELVVLNIVPVMLDYRQGLRRFFNRRRDRLWPQPGKLL